MYKNLPIQDANAPKQHPSGWFWRLEEVKLSSEIKGFIYISINATLLAVIGILFEYSRLTGTQMALSTSAVGTCLAIALFALVEKRKNVVNKKYVLALLNGPVFGGGVIFFLYSSMDRMGPMGATVVQIFTSIITALIVEKFRLKKAPHWLSIVAVVLGFIGMLFLTQSSSQSISISFSFNTYVVGVLFGFMSGLFCFAFFHCVKWMNDDTPDSWHWLAYMIGCTPPCLPVLVDNLELPSCEASVQYFGIMAAFCQSICSLMAIKGFLLIKASAAFIFQLMASVLSFLLQLLFLPHLTQLFSCVGAFLIVIAIAIQFVVSTKLEKKKGRTTTN